MAVTSEPVVLEESAQDDLALERRWYLFAVAGAVSAVIGLLVLAYPDPSVKLLGVFLGIDLLIAGVLMIVRGAGSGGEPADAPYAILLGTIALITGLVVIRNPEKTLGLLTIAVGIYFVVAGALALGRGLVRRERRWASLAGGLVLVAAGTIIISSPHIGLKTFVVLSGIALIFQGAIELAEAVALRSMGRKPAAR
jgi:hypothetical protein